VAKKAQETEVQKSFFSIWGRGCRATAVGTLVGRARSHGVLQCIAVCCGVVRCIAVFCSRKVAVIDGIRDTDNLI